MGLIYLGGRCSAFGGWCSLTTLCGGSAFGGCGGRISFGRCAFALSGGLAFFLQAN